MTRLLDEKTRARVEELAARGRWYDALDLVQDQVEGAIDLGLVSGDAAYAAFHGTHEFSAAPQTELRTIGAVYSSISNWMALNSSSLFYVHDLKAAVSL